MSEAALQLPAGSIIGGYRIEALLGRGSFGITYLVEDVSLGLKFALKEYLPGAIALRDPDGRVVPRSESVRVAFEGGLRQFLKEGRTLAGLDHPNVVKVIRYFEERGTAYLLMTYYEGQPLHRMLASGGVFDAAEIMALALPLMDALDYIHGLGITHRDLKPANIYVTRDGQPILLDFGAARVARAQGDEAVPALGSKGYAALEQMSPDGRLGPWTDIYGLAATLYRLLTGEIPDSAQDRWSSLSSSSSDPLTPLKGLTRPDTDARFIEAIEIGLRVAVEDRPASVAEWRRNFRFSTTAGKPAPVERKSPGKQPGRGSVEETEWLPKILAGIFVLALVAVAIYLLVGGGDSDPDDEANDASTELPVEAPTTLAEDAVAWEQAVRADNATAYRTYLETFPQGRNAADALAQLKVLDQEYWDRASARNDLAAYQEYLESFPDGAYLVEARARIEAFGRAERIDDDAWTDANNARTISALDEYMGNFPQGRHLADARELKARIEAEIRDDEAWVAAERIGRSQAYQAYLNSFPQGRHVAAALAALDGLVLRPGKQFRDCTACPDMVVLPPGSFQQGSAEESALARANEKPQRPVRFSRPFAIGVHEVTFSQWEVCVSAGACRSQTRDNGWGRSARPIILVTWNDAQDYVTWLSGHTGEIYELPSESQWEYAARAGETGDWTGGSPEQVCNFGNIAGAETGFDWRHDACSDPFSAGTAAAGNFRSNAYGVFDMVGNVAEWTRDCMNLSYLDAPADGTAWERGMCASRLTRGGSWFSGSHEIRLPARFNLQAGERNDFTGFRVVRVIRD